MTNSDLRQYLHSYVCTHTHTSKQTILKNKADPLLWIPDWWVPSSGQRPVRNYPSSSLTSKGCAPGSFLPAGGVKSNGYCCDAVCYTGSAASQLYPWNLPGTGQTHPPESFLTGLLGSHPHEVKSSITLSSWGMRNTCMHMTKTKQECPTLG